LRAQLLAQSPQRREFLKMDSQLAPWLARLHPSMAL
jgi:hypothetical protein